MVTTSRSVHATSAILYTEVSCPQVECPTGSGEYMNLVEVAEEIQHRIIHIFARDVDGRRSTNGGNDVVDHDPHFRDYVWFYEVCQNTVAASWR